MKTINILIPAFVFLAFQACGPKTNESKSETVAAPVSQVKMLTIKQKREKLEKERIAKESRLKAEREALAKNTPTYTDSKGNIIYNKAEMEPTYFGGKDGLTNYLHDNLKYPETARQHEEEGTVFVDFIVQKNGTVREVEVTDAYNADVDQSFRDEAFRVVSAMQRWTPGSQHGKNVDVKYNLPVTFRLN